MKKNVKILLVGTESLGLGALSIAVKNLGYNNVAKEMNAREAINIIKKRTVDVMLLDMNMPEMTGMEILEEIRKFNKKTSIVMLGADATIEDVKQALSLGANSFICKPLNAEKIQHTFDYIDKMQEQF